MLVAANLLSWTSFIVARPPLSPEYFVRRDPLLNGRTMYLKSGDPPIILARRPLFYWSEHHGGEHIAVKALELPNIVPLFFSWLLGGIVTVLWPMSLVAQSNVRLAILLFLSSVQWWGVGRLVEVGITAWHRRQGA